MEISWDKYLINRIKVFVQKRFDEKNPKNPSNGWSLGHDWNSGSIAKKLGISEEIYQLVCQSLEDFFEYNPYFFNGKCNDVERVVEWLKNPFKTPPCFVDKKIRRFVWNIFYLFKLQLTLTAPTGKEGV